MKTTTTDTAAPLPLPLHRPVRLRRVVEWLVSAAVACFGVYLMLE
ncbi:hypothetical protein [Methylibium sp.]|jgi:hypothetical protein